MKLVKISRIVSLFFPNLFLMRSVEIHLAHHKLYAGSYINTASYKYRQVFEDEVHMHDEFETKAKSTLAAHN